MICYINIEVSSFFPDAAIRILTNTQSMRETKCNKPSLCQIFAVVFLVFRKKQEKKKKNTNLGSLMKSVSS